ncbi:MAG: ACP phosphodiesterase [Chitinophagaceae bacterium]|nr:ACP phosphodiesterase [Chitinophagaceae bacterium]
MNYLAHARLSFGSPDILAGNLFSDFVKGKALFLYPDDIQLGIRLHRFIDIYTDKHEATSVARSFFRSHYRHYSGVFADIIFDHFLANDSLEFPDNTLYEFSQSVYETLHQRLSLMPAAFRYIFPDMKSQNWLYHYKSFYGVERSMRGLVRRAKYLNNYRNALNLFQQHYESLNECYRRLWKDLKPAARNFLYTKNNFTSEKN